jgi:tripartite-type tricarboxylate transporter receptor subunit TctC
MRPPVIGRRSLHQRLGAASRVAWAQSYPSRPVRIIITTAAGSPADLAHLMGQWLSERLGQPFVARPAAA